VEDGTAGFRGDGARSRQQPRRGLLAQARFGKRERRAAAVDRDALAARQRKRDCDGIDFRSQLAIEAQ